VKKYEKLPSSLEELTVFPDCYTNIVLRNSGNAIKFIQFAEWYYENDGVETSKQYMIVFAHAEGLIELTKTECLSIDGTFAIVPAIFKKYRNSSQFVTIGSFRRALFPRCYAFLTSKSSKSYIHLFQVLKNLAPQQEWQVKKIITDFEPGFLAGLNDINHLLNRSEETAIGVVGCFFHFSKAVFGKIQEVGLKIYYVESRTGLKNFVSDLIALAFIPQDDVLLCFNQLQVTHRAAATAARSQPFRIFQEYFISQWISNIPMWNVYDVPHRTNNALESLHKVYIYFFQAHANIWKFMEVLQTMEQNMALEEFYFLENGILLRQNISGKKQERLKRLDKLLVEFKSGNLDVMQYLKAVSNRMPILD
jgi:hypothetical protein